MKIKVLHHDPNDYAPSRPHSGQVTRYHRNTDPLLHPFQQAREYTRAVNAAKLEKIFAKPFLAAFEGHNDTISAIAKSRTMIAPLFTGACDGEIRFWNLAHRRCYKAIKAHAGWVRGMAVTRNDASVLSCGDDKTVKLWRFDATEAAGELSTEVEGGLGALDQGTAAVRVTDEAAVATFHTPSLVYGIDCHSQMPDMFATACDGTVDLWNVNRAGSPLQSFEWNSDGLICVKFNLAHDNLLGITARDNSIMLYDVRQKSGIRKNVLANRSNALVWNPREPHIFSVANEDTNLYTFDMRKLDTAVRVHKGHIQAVTDVDYNPTGRQLVSAGYDKTIRLWNPDQSRAVNVYHTKRMQRVYACKYSGDGRMIVSGSEDANLRLWKSKADMKLGTLSDREKKAMAYREKLKARFSHMDDVRKVRKHNRLPKWIKSKADKVQVQEASQKRKLENRMANEPEGRVKKPDSGKKMVVREEV